MGQVAVVAGPGRAQVFNGVGIQAPSAHGTPDRAKSRQAETDASGHGNGLQALLRKG